MELKNLKEDQYIEKWLSSITRSSTSYVYICAMKYYLQYTKLTPFDLINEAIEDLKKDPRERKDIVKKRLIGFYNWLVNEAPRHKMGGKKEIIGKGVSQKLAHTYVNAIRSFYSTFDINIKLKGRSALPKPRVKNKRMIITALDVKKLIDHARTPRDRAIIITLFQSGMDVSTLCGLKYGDIKEGLEKNEYPLKLDLYRKKSGTSYFTFLGKDSIEYIKAYLNDLKSKGIELNPNDPLFLKESHKAKKKEGITDYLIQNMLREVAIRSGLIDKNLNGKDFNPLSPHALRESFSSIMLNKGVPDTIVDFWLGHEIGEMAEAYKKAKFEELKQLYLEKEKYISISSIENFEKIKLEIEQKNKQLQDIINNLVAENLELKSRISKLELEFTELKKQLQNIITYGGSMEY